MAGFHLVKIMPALLTILFTALSAAVGIVCARARFGRTSGPKDAALIWRFLFSIGIVVMAYGIAFVLTPAAYRNWLFPPLLAAGMFLIFRFRRRRREVQREEEYLEPQKRDGSWIKEVR